MRQTWIIRLGVSALLFWAGALVLDSAAFPGGAARACVPIPEAAGSEKAGKPAKESKELGGWRAPGKARAVLNPIEPTLESVARGQVLFEKSCARCHGPQGHGDGKMAKALATKPADLTLRLPPQSDGEIFWKVGEGKSPMPSFNKDLKPEQRWDVVNYLRQVILAAGKSGEKSGKKAMAGDSAQTQQGTTPAGGKSGGD